ncbi:MAG: S-adenosylmethionine:tRNA ribosyltransferase-isomerase, partial [Candidatus Woesearchaeota archaeon]
MDSDRKFSIEDFDYYVPKDLIAQEPIQPRDKARLMILQGFSIQHKIFSDIPNYVGEGDVLVINNTRVIPARFFGRKESGGRVEALLVRKRSDGSWEALVSGKNIKPGSKLLFDDFSAEILSKEGNKFILSFSSDAEDILPKGEVPLPHYIKKRIENPEDYQTVYSKRAGAIASPTAGLHFTPQL